MDATEARASELVIDGLVERLERRSRESGEPPTINVLALSGGGDKGAFGAGFLVGWGSVDDPASKRPDFDLVTGVSTGAMIAPFAFLGTDADYRSVDEFYRNPKPDWTAHRGLLFFLPSNESLETLPGLERELSTIIDGAFAARMATEARGGKALVISATDIDLARQRLWDVVEVAIEAGQRGDGAPIRRIMLASAAVPAAFPPVDIDGNLYVDGGVTANVLLRLDPFSRRGFVQLWRSRYPGRPLPRIRYWIIVNGQINFPPETTRLSWLSIAGRSLELSIASATFSQIGWLVTEANYVNRVFDADIEIRVVAIPDTFRRPVAGTFQEATMRALSDLGRSMGANPGSWRRFGAPEDGGLAPGELMIPSGPDTPAASMSR